MGGGVLVNEQGLRSRQFSSILVDGPERAASRAMLHAVGFKTTDFKKNQIGIASTWSQVTPCNMHIDKLALESAKGVDAAGGKSIIFNTITISDGISMGTQGMRLRMTIDRERCIVDLQAWTEASPYPDCAEIEPAYRQLIGHRIEPGFTQLVKQLFRRTAGCSHMTELLPPMASTMWPRCQWAQVAPTTC